MEMLKKEYSVRNKATLYEENNTNDLEQKILKC